jgi:transposase
MKRRQHSDDLKAKVVIESIKGEDTVNVIAKKHGIHPLLITKWKKQALTLLPSLFSRKVDKEHQDWEERESELFQEIGRLKFELDWLKKKSARFDQ